MRAEPLAKQPGGAEVAAQTPPGEGGRRRGRGRAPGCTVLRPAYLTGPLRRPLAPSTLTAEHPPARTDPVAPAARSAAASRKTSRRKDNTGQPVRSFRTLLDHLATLTRNDVRVTGTQTTVPILAEPTPTQRRVFELLNQPVPINLT